MTPPVAGYSLWLDASDATKITQSSNLISQWVSSDANAWAFSQGVGANQPSYANSINGLKTVTFTAASSTSLRATTFTSIVQPYTIIAAYKVDDTAATARIFDTAGATGGRILFNATNAKTGIYGGTTLDGSANSTTAIIHTGIFNGNSSTSFANGVSDAAGAAGSSATGSNSFYLGTDSGATFFTGKLCEMVIYPSALSTANRQQVEGYLSGKWAIAATVTIGPDTETGTGTDADTNGLALIDTETGTGTDADTNGLVASQTDTETGTGTDSATNAVAATFSDTETGTSVDAGELLGFTDTETGTGTDSDAGPVATFTDTETGTGTDSDTAALMAVLTDIENGTGLDDDSFALQITVYPTGPPMVDVFTDFNDTTGSVAQDSGGSTYTEYLNT